MNPAPVLLTAGLLLSGGSGFLTAAALSTQSAPAKTVTVNVATGPQGPRGEQGPPGPQGPQGPAGASGSSCPSGFKEGELVINHPGGQTIIWTCLKN